MFGGLALLIGLTASPTVDARGKESDPKAFTIAGAVIGTAGLAALVTGVVLMTQNRPSHRPGVTTTFRVP